MTPIRCLAALILASILSPIAWATDLGISPPRVELQGSPGAEITTSVSIITGPGRSQEIVVEPSDWTLDGRGGLVLLNPGSNPLGASSWLQPEADGVEVSPNSARQFRVSVKIPDEPGLAGTYTAMLFFRVAAAADAKRGLAVATSTRIGFTIYVTIAGTETSGSVLTDLYLSDDRTLTAAVRNDGNTVMRLGGKVELRDESGAVRYTLPIDDLPVLRESERDVTIKLPDEVEPGTYVALALVEDSRGGLLSGQAVITVP